MSDNGPAYTSTAFRDFLKPWFIKLHAKIPCNPQGQAIVKWANPQGQAIVKWANRSLRKILQKQKRGDGLSLPPQQKLHKALFTLKFLHQDNDFTAAEWHFTKEQQQQKNSPQTIYYMVWSSNTLMA